MVTDLPGEIMSALQSSLSQFGVVVPNMPSGIMGAGAPTTPALGGLTAPAATPGLTAPGLTGPGLTAPGLTTPGLTAPGLTAPTAAGLTDPSLANPALTPGTAPLLPPTTPTNPAIPGLTTPPAGLTPAGLTTPGLTGEYRTGVNPALTSPLGAANRPDRGTWRGSDRRAGRRGSLRQLPAPGRRSVTGPGRPGRPVVRRPGQRRRRRTDVLAVQRGKSDGRQPGDRPAQGHPGALDHAGDQGRCPGGCGGRGPGTATATDPLGQPAKRHRRGGELCDAVAVGGVSRWCVETLVTPDSYVTSARGVPPSSAVVAVHRVLATAVLLPWAIGGVPGGRPENSPAKADDTTMSAAAAGRRRRRPDDPGGQPGHAVLPGGVDGGGRGHHRTGARTEARRQLGSVVSVLFPRVHGPRRQRPSPWHRTGVRGSHHRGADCDQPPRRRARRAGRPADRAGRQSRPRLPARDRRATVRARPCKTRPC